MTIPVSIFTTREGHVSLSEKAGSIVERAGHKIFINDHGGSEFNIYTPFYQLFPQLWNIPYQLHKNKKAISILHSYAKMAYQDKVLKELKEQKPQVVISTWFLLNEILAGANTHNSYKFFNIVSDPRSFATLTVHKDALNFVFDQKAKNRAISFGIPKENIVVSGWFVRDRFEKRYSQVKIKKLLNFHPNKIKILIVAGSEGTATILKILPAFVNCGSPVDVVVACGGNKRLIQTVRAIAKLIKLTNGQNTVSITALGFTRDIHLYMQAADLVMGKAGPNLLFESVATRTPFFAITHIAGQEDGNLDIIKEYKIGWVEEDPIKAIKLLKSILKNPSSLEKFDPHLNKLALHNLQSKKILNSYLPK